VEDFTLIPRELFYIGNNKNNDNITDSKKKNNKKGLIKEYNNDKLLLVSDFLDKHRLKNEKIEFVLKNMIQIYGIRINNHKNGINEQFKNALITLEDLNFIKNVRMLIPKVKETSMKDISLIDYVECEFNILTKVKKENSKDKNTNFIQLYQDEKDKILQYDDEKDKIDNAKMLVYYCYLKARMYKRSKIKGDRVMSGGRNEVCYPSFERICEDINITEKIIMKYNQILVGLDLIRYDSAGLWYYASEGKKYLRESNNTYILCQDGWEEELKDAIKFYREKEEENGKIFFNKKSGDYKHNNRVINGYIGRINYLEGKGNKLTEEQIEKRDKYQKIIDMYNKEKEEKLRKKKLNNN